MMLGAGVAVALAVAAVGLWVVPAGPIAARWLGWLTTLAFACVATFCGDVVWSAGEAPPPAVAVFDATPGAGRSGMLAAAAAAGPRAADLQLVWRGPLPAPRTGAGALPGTAGPGTAAAGTASPGTAGAETADRGPADPGTRAPDAGVLGALALAPRALPWSPAAVQVRAGGAAAVDRPLLLAVESPPLAAPVAAELIVRAGDRVALRAAVELGVRAAVSVTFTPSSAGPHTLELRAGVPGATLVWRGGFDVGAPPTVLVVEPSGRAAAALRAQGVAVVEAPALPPAPADHAAVLLGVPLPVAEQERLVAAVHDGLGVLVLPAAFGNEGEPLRTVLPLRPRPAPEAATDEAGARARTPPSPAPPPRDPPPAPPKPPDEPPRGDVAQPGPVNPEPIEVDKRAIAMVLLVDRSGSMGALLPDGKSKMSYAKTSALRTARALGAGDSVAIATFGNKNSGRVELPLTDATAEPVVIAGVERLAHANEQTFLLDGLRVAHEQLRPARAAVKHVVVVSDGEFNTNEMLALTALANRMRADDHITLSLITIVDGMTAPSFVKGAERLAQDGGGMFFAVTDPTSVPAFVSAEVTRSLQRVGRQPRRGGGGARAPEPTEPPPVEPKPEPPKPDPPKQEPEPPPPEPPSSEPPEERALPVRAVAASPLLAPLPEAAWPSLLRATPGEAPLDAHVLLVAGDEGWPLLAFGNRGLGRVAAFAADLFEAPGDAFRAEPAFPARLAQWVQALLPASPQATSAGLLGPCEVSPAVPTPEDHAALAAVAGSAPSAAASAPPAVWRRALEPPPPLAVLALVLAVVLLAAGERVLAARALRRGGDA